MIKKLDEAPISSKQVTTWTQRDHVLSRVHQYIMLGWPKEADDEIKPCWNRHTHTHMYVCDVVCVIIMLLDSFVEMFNAEIIFREDCTSG